MPKENNYKWKLGLFAIAALVIAVAGIYYIGKERNKFGSVVHLSAYFNTVSGLKVGSNVRVGGIDVGTVDGISLVNDTTVEVDMLIQSGVRKFIRKDAKASIGSDGLMGDKVIAITAGTPASPIVANGDSLTSKEPIETDAIMASLKTSADNAAIITTNLADISNRISHGRGALGKLLHDTTLSSNISATMKHLNSSTQKLDENMEAAQHNFLFRGYFRKKEKKRIEDSVKQAKALELQQGKLQKQKQQ
jgi:phospholipid/cholesterol/gamma-HCH transport system substrate-binding protein